MNEKKAALELESFVKGKGESSSLQDYSIPVTIRNASSVGFSRAEVSVKENETNVVRSANFSRIPSKSSATQNISMPGGVEMAAFNIFPEVGEKIFGMGFGDNVPAVNITISD